MSANHEKGSLPTEGERAVSVKTKRHPTEMHGALGPPAACKARHPLGGRIAMQTVTKPFLCEMLWFWADKTLYRHVKHQVPTTCNHVQRR